MWTMGFWRDLWPVLEQFSYMERFSTGEFSTDDFVSTSVRLVRHEDGDMSTSQLDYVRQLTEIELGKPLRGRISWRKFP